LARLTARRYEQWLTVGVAVDRLKLLCDLRDGGVRVDPIRAGSRLSTGSMLVTDRAAGDASRAADAGGEQAVDHR
jgi:hypothetical protein